MADDDILVEAGITIIVPKEVVMQAIGQLDTARDPNDYVIEMITDAIRRVAPQIGEAMHIDPEEVIVNATSG